MADLGLGGNNRQSADYGRRQRKVSTGGGYAAAPGGAYPNSSQYDTGAHAPPGGQQYPYSAASAASPNRAHSPMPNMDRQPGSPYQANRNSYAGGGHISRGPSPSPYGANPPGAYPGSAQSPNADQGMLPAPEGFSRPPNAAQSYTNFETMKIQDMEEFLEQIPRMPLVLVPHDVYHEDWIRLMTVSSHPLCLCSSSAHKVSLGSCSRLGRQTSHPRSSQGRRPRTQTHDRRFRFDRPVELELLHP